jgi:hypothetical protein
MMTSRRAAFYVAVWLLLTVVWLFTGRSGRDGGPREDGIRQAANPFGDLTPAQVGEVEVEAAAGRARFVRSAGGWRVAAPAEGAAAADLLSAFLSALLEVEEAEVIPNGTGREGEFGLDRPTGRVVLGREDGAPLRIVLGARNPSGTAVYARLEDSPEVVLLGLNVPYYLDLALRAAGAAPRRRPSERP